MAACLSGIINVLDFHKIRYGQTDQEPGIYEVPEGFKQQLAFYFFLLVSSPNKVKLKNKNKN